MEGVKKYAVALTASLGLIMAILDNTIVNVALTPMSIDLNASLSAIQWVVTAYFLAQAAVIPVAGYFSNRFGIKRLYMLCLVLFVVGSYLCGTAQDEATLIVFRVMQGLGGGALFPLAQALAFGAFPPQERATASALVSVPVLLAPAFGPTLGGYLTDSFGWGSIFLINVPIGIVTVLLAWRILPKDEVVPGATGSFDYVGLILSTLGVLAVVFGFTLVSEPQPGTQTASNPEGVPFGWSFWGVWALIALGVLILALFAVYELRRRDPVLDLRLFKRWDFTIPSVVIWFNAMIVFGSIFLLPVFFQRVRTPPLSATEVGLALMPQGLASAVAVTLGGRLYHRVGVRALVMVGVVLLMASSWRLANLSPTTSGFDLLPWLIMRGLGFGFTFFPAQTRALERITGPALPKASSLFNVTRQIASSIGIAAVTTFFVQRTAARSVPDISPSLAGTFAMNDTFWVVTIGTGLMLLITLALPGREAAAADRAETGARPSVSFD